VLFSRIDETTTLLRKEEQDETRDAEGIKRNRDEAWRSILIEYLFYKWYLKSIKYEMRARSSANENGPTCNIREDALQ